MKTRFWMIAAATTLSMAAVETAQLRSHATAAMGEASLVAVQVAAPKDEWLRQIPEVPVREAREILRHGDGMDVPDWAAFVREPHLVLDSKGRLYVLPRSDDPRVRVLDQDGAFVRYVGRRGDGPGEFTSIAAMGLAGDTLWLQDFPTGRTSFFDQDGTHLYTEPAVPQYPGRPRTYGADEGSTEPLAGGRALYEAPKASIDDPPGRQLVPLMVGPRTATGRRDTVALVPSPSGMYVQGVGTFSFAPATPSPLYSALANGQGVATASWAAERPGEVVLRRFGLDGRLQAEQALRFPASKMSSEARDRFIDEGVEKARGPWEFHRKNFDGVPDDLRAAVVEGLALPDHYSPIDDMFATQEDRIWLRATAAEGDGGDWFVVGRDGRVEFRVRPPPGVSFETARGNRVWGVGKGEMDMTYIALYELSQPQQGKEGME